MQHASIETRIKCRLHDVVAGAILSRNLTRHELAKLTDRNWSKQCWNRLIAGPIQHPHSIDKLAGVARGLGYDVQDDGTCVPAGPRQLPQRHAVPLGA